MPIEIREINIKADVYPANRRESNSAEAVLSAQEVERLKKEITKDVTQAVLEKIHQTFER